VRRLERFVASRGWVVAVVLSSGCAGAPADSVRREIQARYVRASSEAVAARTYTDAESTHQWIDTPDCTYTNTDRPPRSWSEMRSEVEAGLRTRLLAFSTEIQSLQVHGDGATAVALVTGTARITDDRGELGPKGATHDVVTTATVRDEWVKTADGWRRRSHVKIVPNKITQVDGKPFGR